MSQADSAAPRLRVAVYADVDLNVIDGSSIWLQSMSQVLAGCADVEVVLILKTAVQNRILLAPLEAVPNIRIVSPFEEQLPDLSRSLSPNQVVRILDREDSQDKIDLFIVRNIRVALHAARFARFGGRLCPYLTDIPQTHPAMTEEHRATLHEIAEESRHFLCQTAELCEFLEEMVPAIRGKTVLFPPVVPDASSVAPARSFPENRPLKLVYSGKYAADWKTLEMTRLPRLLAERGIRAELHCIGEKINRDPSDATFPDRMRGALTTETGVVTHGAVPRKTAMQLVADCDLALSWRSTELNDSLELSTKLLEYGRVGVPVLLNRNPAHEQLLGADYPLFVETLDDIVERVVELQGAPDDLMRARERCLAAAESFSLENARQRLEPLLRGLRPPSVSVAGRQRPLRVVVASHDLKFFTSILQSYRASPELEVRVDQWSGLHPGSHDEAESRKLLDWADVIICEWCAYNAVWYSREKRSHQKLFIRFHRFEKDLAYPKQVAFDKVTQLICVGDFYRDLVRTQYSWDALRVRVIPDYVDVEAYARPKLSGARFHLGLLGAVPLLRKRLDRAIDVLELLRQVDRRYRLFTKGALPWDLWWVWKDPDEQAATEALFARLRGEELLHGAVVFDRYGADTAQWFQKIGFILSTSTSESFHLSPCEGMASSAVPMLWDWEGVESIYERRWVHSSAREIADHILSIEQTQFAKLGEECRNWVQRYSLQRVLRRWHALLHE